MYFFSSKTLFFFLSLMLSISLSDIATAQEKPLLSNEIRETIDTEGVESAVEKFISMNQSDREQFEVDMEGISELTNAYVEEGNMEALMAISEITSVFMQDVIAKSMEQYGSGLEEMEKMAEQREAEQEQQRMQREQQREAEHRQTVVERQGQPRDDLQRFKGVYGNPENPDSFRQLWVNTSCDGYLVVGAMWGDAAPWWMRSESDNVFTLEDSFNNIRMEFQGDRMTHNLEIIESPLQREGALPDDWASCIEQYR